MIFPLDPLERGGHLRGRFENGRGGRGGKGFWNYMATREEPHGAF
jgi:hypothetical protein